MKKVLMITGSLPPIRCGVGYYAERLSRELAAGGLEFSILSTKGVDKDTPAPLLTVPNWKIRSLPKMLSAIKKSEAEIIHIQYPTVGYRRQLGINLLPYVLRLTKPHLKILITLHEYHQSRWIGRWRNSITIWPAHLIFVSNHLDKLMLRRLGGKVLIVPIGANFDVAPRNPEFFKKILRSQKLDPNKPTLIFFGYAFPSKKLELLLDALGEPELKCYQALLLASLDKKTQYQRALQKQVDRLNRDSPRVGTTGFLEGEDVSAIMQEVKYFVLPLDQPISAKSGTAIAAVQNGMIVVSRGAAQPDATAPFAHLKNCYLLDEVSGRTIASTIKHLDNSPDETRTILQGAAELKNYFSWPHIIKEHLRIYGEL